MSRRRLAQIPTQTVEIIALLGLAALLAAVHFFLPEPLRSQFLFTYGEPSVVSAWTAAILHDSVSHLLSNVTWYVVVIISTHTLLTEWNRRRVFWVAVVGCLLVAPPVTKLVDYWVLMLQWNLVTETTTARGFSGVVSAFGGMLYISLAWTATTWHGYDAGVATTGAIVLGALIILAVTSIVVPEIVAVVLCVATVAVIGTKIVSRRSQIPEWQAWVVSHRDPLLLIGGGSAVVVVLLSQLFHVELDATGRFVNVIAHGTGFATGMIVTQLVLVLEYVGRQLTETQSDYLGT